MLILNRLSIVNLCVLRGFHAFASRGINYRIN